jgi:hexosaminidase
MNFLTRFVAFACLPLVVASGLLYTAAASAQPAPQAGSLSTLMPLPAKVVPHTGSLAITPAFSYSLGGNAGARLSQATVRLMARIGSRTGIPLPKTSIATGLATFTIDVPPSKAPETVPQPDVDESYTLDIDAQHIALTAKTDIGALRGMETLLQLVEPAGTGYVLPAVHIEDAPRFPWRGLMLDSGRHFLPVPVILRTLDGMASVKLNVLHWHLTEDQGFRIESKLYPKLQELGSNGQYYTQEQVREVVVYASARGIRVVPEFDMPGHTQSWLVGYPELASAAGPYTIDAEFGISDAALDPTRESTYKLIDGFLGEMSALFPDPYLHIGGDESNGKEWLSNPAIKAFMAAHGFKTTPELQTYFSTRVQKILAAHHKQMVGWDEILNPALPTDAVIQNWHGMEFLIDGAKQGHRAFLSHPYYLDHMYPASEMFLADPLPADAGLTPEQQKLILGGEACMWGEHVVPATLDSRIWPRAAAVAERFWSPATDRDVDDMYRRLGVETLRLEYEGLWHMSGSVRIQRLAAGSAQIQPLEAFVNTLQPVDFHIRSREQRVSTLTVFDRLVDAARPDPALRHDLPQMVDAAIKGDAAATAKLRKLFQSWVDAAPALAALEAGSPVLQEAHAHIAAFPKLGAMGLEALKALDARTPPSTGWLDEQKAVLKAAVRPHELVEFVVLGPLGKLVEAAAKPSAAKADPIHDYLQPLVDNHTIAGAVTLVADKTHTVYIAPVGFRDKEANAPMTADDLFWIASVSKPITATAFMMLVDEGKVNLDDPVEKYLPEFKGQKVYRARPDPKNPLPVHPNPADLVPASHPITVREILSHSSGLPFKSAAQPGALDLLPLKDAVRSFAAEPLLFQPFTAYSYSNEGINTAGRIIEVVTGMSYEQFLQERLFTPLGMNDTTFWPSEGQSARIATSYKLDTQTGALKPVQVDQLTYPLSDRARRFPMPAGGLFSTAADLEKFCRMLLNGGELDGKRYISAQSLHLMTSMENGGFGNTDYGFGWSVSPSGYGHGGAYKNSIDIDPAAGRALIFMVQQSGPWGTAAGDRIPSTLKKLANEAVGH